jgi:hypothetical protein
LQLKKIQEILNAELLTPGIGEALEVSSVNASDLMSDVLTCSDSGSLLLTGLTNSQAIRTVSVADLCAVVFVRGKVPPQETIELAVANRVPLLCTKLSMYEACGKLFSSGIPGP